MSSFVEQGTQSVFQVIFRLDWVMGRGWGETGEPVDGRKEEAMTSH